MDHDAAAATLGLDVVDARLKIGFPAPEVLKAADPDRAAEVAASLKGAGLEVAVVDGRELAEVPWPAPVTSFGFAEDALVARVADEEIAIPYDVPVLGVHCKPPADFTIWRADESEPTIRGPDADGPAVAEAIEWMAVLDLYFRRGMDMSRISIVQDVTDFSGLGAAVERVAMDGTTAMLSECERRFERIELDTRLENVRPRRRFRGGDAGFDIDMRKLYSFGTLLLRQALDSISPELGDVPQYELGSRLAYVLSRQRTS